MAGVPLVGSARRWLWVTGAASTAVALLVLTAVLAPWGPKMIDLDVYRTGAATLLGGRDLYGVVDAGTGLPFTYPIFAAVVFVPLALLPLAVARVVITLLTLAGLVVICQLALRLGWRRTGAGAVAVSIAVAALAVSAHPVLDTILFGQINVILVALVLVDIVLVTGRGRGVLVGLAAGIKLTPGLFILYYLVTGDRRAARTAAVSAAATVLVGFAVQPGPAWAFWTRYVFDPARTGNVTYAGNQSLLALTARLLRVEHPPAVLVDALTVAVVGAALVLARRLHRAGDALAAVCAVAAGALLASPISWSHHWVWFLPAAFAVAAWIRRTGGGWRWWLLGLAVAVMWSGPMRFTPTNGLRELHHNPAQQVVANSFSLLALGYLAWAWYLTGPRARRRPALRRGVRGGEDVDHEAQRTGGRAGGPGAVGEVGGDVQLHPAADLHPDQPLIPALDDGTGADRE